MADPTRFRDLVTSDERRARYVEAGWWDDATLASRVERHGRAGDAATRVAVVDEGGEHTWAELHADSCRAAAGLAALGVGRGEVVSVQLPNRYETVVAAVAALSLGAVVNPLLPNYRARELGHVFATARPAVVLTPGRYRDADHRQLVAQVAGATGVRPRHVVVGDEPGAAAVSWHDLLGGASAARSLGSGPADAVSEIIFTSGTEATPKAILHTEQTAGFSVRVARDDLGVEPADVVWMPSPVGHSTGFNYGLRFALHHGLTLVLQDRWDAERAVELVDRYGCSYTLAATTFLQDLVGAARSHERRLDSLRFFGCGGAPVPPPLVDAAGEAGIDVLRLYGSTEVLVATWNRRDSPAAKRRDTDGRAMSHVEIEVRRDDGSVATAGEPGEGFVRGPNTCVGFFADPERTAATFSPDGWVRSGDMLAADGDGYVSVVGRKKEILIRGGINIAPREIEELLVAFGEVERAAVVGLPDERLGERMCACVVLAPGATLGFDDMVRRLTEAGLARYKLPERLEALDALPMTASGKVQKHEIVRLLTAGRGEEVP